MGILIFMFRIVTPVLTLLMIFFAGPGLVFSENINPDTNSNIKSNTMLMFVGEDISVTTLASGKPESPANAPAVARVVTAEEIKKYGYQTLADLLDSEPGFLILPKGQGSVSWLRGMPDSILFLYDGVPMTQAGTRNLNFLDRELSLKGVKRVEIIRGPGSVLWGADAFAGIVNIVPMTGLDAGGSTLSVYGGTDNLIGSSCSSGASENNWTFFLDADLSKKNVSDNRFNVTAPGTDPGSSDNTVSKKIGHSWYSEAGFKASMAEKFSFSGRIFDFTREFTMHDAEGLLSWKGTRASSPSGYLKGTWNISAGAFNIKASAYYNSISNDVTMVDLEQDQDSRIWHTELLCDRNLFKTGLLTAGVSFSDVNFKGGVVSKDFLPQSLKPENSILLPIIDQRNYTDIIKSVFVQYRHRLAKIHWWAGVRFDDHSAFDSKTSFNFGFNLPFSKQWRLKAGFGTAYRTPYLSQSFSDVSYEPEGVETYNIQLGWTPVPDTSFTLTSFYSRLHDHIQYDPYGGLSMPFEQKTAGVELSFITEILQNLSLSANATFMNHWGGSAEYLLKSTYHGPGTQRPEDQTWHEPFDSAADYMVNCKAVKRFNIRGVCGTFAIDLHKTGSVPYTYEKGTVTGEYNSPVIVGLNLRIDDFLTKHITLAISADNIFDQDFKVPDMYGPANGEPFSTVCTISYRF